MTKTQLLLTITNNNGQRRVEVLRCDNCVPDFTITEEQQVLNSKLGIICDTSNLNEVIEAVTETVVSS